MQPGRGRGSHAGLGTAGSVFCSPFPLPASPAFLRSIPSLQQQEFSLCIGGVSETRDVQLGLSLCTSEGGTGTPCLALFGFRGMEIPLGLGLSGGLIWGPVLFVGFLFVGFLFCWFFGVLFWVFSFLPWVVFSSIWSKTQKQKACESPCVASPFKKDKILGF